MKTNRTNSLKLIVSSVTSKLGNVVFDYANQSLIATLFPNSPIFLSYYQSSESITQIAFNLFGGAFSDRYNRRKILIVTDLISALACLIGLFFVKSSLLYLCIIILNIVLALCSSFNSPTYNAIVKECITTDYIDKHLSKFAFCKEITTVCSPLIGIFLWSNYGVEGAYIFNMITFLVSAFIESKLISIFDKTSSEKRKNILLDIKKGIEYIYENKTVFYLLILSSLVNFMLSAYNLMLPYTNVILKNELSNFYGKAIIAESIGSIIFSFLISKKEIENIVTNKKIMVFSMFMCGLSLLFFPIIYKKTGNAYICLLSILLFGGSLTVYNINFFSVVQKTVDINYIGRVLSVIFTIAVLFMPLGSLIFGVLLRNMVIDYFYFIGIGLIFLILIFILFEKRLKFN